MSTATHSRNREIHDCKTPSQVFEEAELAARSNLPLVEAVYSVCGFIKSCYRGLWSAYQRLLRSHRALSVDFNALLDAVEADCPWLLDTHDLHRIVRQDLDALPVPIDEVFSEQLNERL